MSEHALVDLARRLNEATEELNTAIEGHEKQLNTAKLGVALWMEEPTLADDGSGGGYKLGYQKLGDSWHFAVRSKLNKNTKVVSLRDAPRHVRAEAAAHLGTMFDLLCVEASTVLLAVEHATAAVQKVVDAFEGEDPA